MSKRHDAVEIMKKNSDKPMAVVVGIIADKCDLPILQARAYYRWIVENKLANGVIEDARLRDVPTVMSTQKYVSLLKRKLRSHGKNPAFNLSVA